MPTLAAAPQPVKFTIGNNYYFKGDQKVNMDAATFMDSGRTYVPVRYLADALGLTSDWKQANQEVDLTESFSAGADPKTGAPLQMKDTLCFFINQKYMRYQGGHNGQVTVNKKYDIDVAPVIKEGRTYLPARYVAENFDYDVSWDTSTQTVTLTPMNGGEGGL